VAGEGISKSIRAVVAKNLWATQAEDLEAMMSTIHTQSPAYLQTKTQIQPLFDNFDLSYRLLSFRFIGYDKPYAIARVSQRTTKKSGPAFKNNVVDMIQIFRKENGRWKYWNQSILDVRYIE